MMNFKEAYEQFLKGKKIRRLAWSNKDFYYRQYQGAENEGDLSAEDAIAEDWYVIEE